MTNKSCEDLVHKKTEDLTPIETHKDPSKQTGLKRTIKQFEIDRNKLTGLRNFTDLSPDPLALPPYALPPQVQPTSGQNRQAGNQRDSQQRNSKNPDIKQKRPDDKTDRSNRRIQENRRLENKLNVGKQRSAGPSTSDSKAGSEHPQSHKQSSD